MKDLGLALYNLQQALDKLKTRLYMASRDNSTVDLKGMDSEICVGVDRLKKAVNQATK